MTGQDRSQDHEQDWAQADWTGHMTGQDWSHDETGLVIRPDRTGHMTLQDCHMSLVTISYRTRSPDLKGPVSHLTHNDHGKRGQKIWKESESHTNNLSLPFNHSHTHTHTHTHTNYTHMYTHKLYTHTHKLYTHVHTHTLPTLTPSDRTTHPVCLQEPSDELCIANYAVPVITYVYCMYMYYSTTRARHERVKI